MIEAKKVSKVYGSKQNQYQALKEVDLVIQDAESIAILGKSGSGKSTLMHLLAGLDSPTSGKISFNGKSLENMNSNELANLRNKNYGFVFQQFFLQPNLSVIENIELPLKIQGIPKSERKDRSIKLLNSIELANKKDSKAVDLSGGQKQRVALARALVTNPSVIFADEPTGNLDEETGDTIIQLLFTLHKEKGTTLVIVTHDQDLARRCNRIVHIKDGILQ